MQVKAAVKQSEAQTAAKTSDWLQHLRSSILFTYINLNEHFIVKHSLDGTRPLKSLVLRCGYRRFGNRTFVYGLRNATMHSHSVVQSVEKISEHHDPFKKLLEMENDLFLKQKQSLLKRKRPLLKPSHLNRKPSHLNQSPHPILVPTFSFQMTRSNVGTICVTDQHSKQTFKDIQASWISSSPFKRTPVMLLNSNGRELGQCPFCNQTTCHRWIAVQGMCAILHQPINPIFHS
ncbi:hypothetical protein TNCV_2057601 [Trichonephila clavipes]|nr:hypothetical protein TNCV_2057601 [Trichonephila clavipes]